MVSKANQAFSLARPRLIATLLIIDGLAHISYGYTSYEYVGDPINILNLLSGFGVDEVLVVDLSASRTHRLNIQLLTKLRAVADFPLSYAGGIRSTMDADLIMRLGFDKIFLSACNPNLSTLLNQVSESYGIQALALSIDYFIASDRRYLYNPYTRSKTQTTLHSFLDSLQVNLMSDLLFSFVDRAGSRMGVDQDILHEAYIATLSNPIVLAGGLSAKGNQLLHRLTELHPCVAGLAASSSIFLQSGCSSALVCLERHF
jgi:cyclase